VSERSGLVCRGRGGKKARLSPLCIKIKFSGGIHSNFHTPASMNKYFKGCCCHIFGCLVYTIGSCLKVGGKGGTRQPCDSALLQLHPPNALYLHPHAGSCFELGGGSQRGRCNHRARAAARCSGMLWCG